MRTSKLFDDVFSVSHAALELKNVMAQRVLADRVPDFLKEESINAHAIQLSLQAYDPERLKHKARLLVNSASEFCAGLTSALSAHGYEVIKSDGNSDSEASAGDKCHSDLIVADQIFSNQRFGEFYLGFLAEHRRDLTEKLTGCIAADRPVVVFTAKKVYFNQLRMSKVLRDKGYRTIALVFDCSMAQHQAGFFDEVIYTDLLSFLLFLNKFDEDVLLHTQGWLFRYHIPVIIDMYKSTRCKQIIEMMDSQSFYLPESLFSKFPNSLKQAWGDNVLENHAVQLACEYYIVHHSDGVIFNGDETYREPLVKRDSQGLRDKHLAFPALPLKDFFYISNQSNQQKRLVFVGGIPPLTNNRPHELFGDSQLLNLVKSLIDSGCYLDIYNNPLLAPESEYKRLYPDYMDMAKSSDRFNFYAGDMPQYINQIISAYDIGLMVYDFCGTYAGDLHFKHLIPTKLFNYLEAGLPVLVSERFSAVCNIVKEYDIGVIIGPDELDLIPEIVAVTDIARLKKNVVAAREKLQMHNNIDRLTGFYQQVMA
ncbi:glycosyltransferase family protein [Methylomonas rhizoryzae]|uniref:glycosyltransferase family 4 protein n=1 Tax=Methylomonas rhizoryzae TaxID=2608981 RepID=UPI001232D98F|nr:glycosyltransferase family 4 protein [Methylomonas rhizoryzae]